MVYKKFYINLIIRLVVFAALCLVIGYIGFNPSYLHTSILLSILILISFLELLHYLNYTNRFFSNYFNSLYESGSKISFDFPDKDASFRNLAQSMSKVWNLLTEARLKQEEEKEFLSNLISHVGIGIIAFNEDGKVRLNNPMSLKIFNLFSLKHWDQLGAINKILLTKIKQTTALNKVFVRCVIDEKLKELVLNISVFKLRGELIRLISIQDINEEMNRKEVLAWQQVIQVMAHEIMSTISPITSLSKHIHNKLNPDGTIIKAGAIDQKLLDDMAEGLEIISSRGEGLTDFINKYRSIAYLPEPQFELINLDDLIKTIRQLAEAEFKENKIVYVSEKNKSIKIDKNLVEQTLLNLIRNSVEALVKSQSKEIVLKTYEYSNGVCLEIFDEGKGVSNEFIDKIFVPFFSTKDKGTGIGLSFARQVMHLHSGEISFTSSENKWTRVKLFFPEK